MNLKELKVLLFIVYFIKHLRTEQTVVLGRNMLAYYCIKNLSSNKITTLALISFSSTQLKLNNMMNNHKQMKIKEKEICRGKDIQLNPFGALRSNIYLHIHMMEL